jgi:AcrR family transcriptional regulator
MNTASEPRRLRADAARNRQALIDAAQRLFAVRGLSATLDDIAAEAGVNVATAYRHFANKHELATAFLQQKIDQAVGIAEDAAAAADPWQGLTDFFNRTLELMVANRGLQDVFTPGYADEWFERLDARFEPVIRRLIDRAQQVGALRTDVEPGDLGVILSMLATVSDVPADDVDTLLRRYLELILAGLRPSERPLPGTAPSPEQARQARMPPRYRGSAAGPQRKPARPRHGS